MDTVLLNADKNNKMFQLDHQNSKNQKFISTNTLNRPESTEKNPQSNISSRQPLPTTYTTNRSQSPYSNNFRGR